MKWGAIRQRQFFQDNQVLVREAMERTIVTASERMNPNFTDMQVNGLAIPEKAARTYVRDMSKEFRVHRVPEALISWVTKYAEREITSFDFQKKIMAILRPEVTGSLPIL